MVNYRGVKVNERNTQITAEIMQTYDLLKFASARDLTALVFSLQHNTKCPS